MLLPQSRDYGSTNVRAAYKSMPASSRTTRVYVSLQSDVASRHANEQEAASSKRQPQMARAFVKVDNHVDMHRRFGGTSRSMLVDQLAAS